mgnify:CR=1 FL=1
MAQCTPKSFDLTGKVALITGASYGIGLSKVADFAVQNVEIEAKHNGWTITAAWLF